MLAITISSTGKRISDGRTNPQRGHYMLHRNSFWEYNKYGTWRHAVFLSRRILTSLQDNTMLSGNHQEIVLLCNMESMKPELQAYSESMGTA